MTDKQTLTTTLIRKALQYDFEPADWEAYLYLQKALHPYEQKWENYVSKIMDDIISGIQLHVGFVAARPSEVDHGADTSRRRSVSATAHHDRQQQFSNRQQNPE